VVDRDSLSRGALAGAVAAGVWALQQPLDKRLFDTRYDDVELLGKLVTRGRGWWGAGFAMHAANGAMFGATYAVLRPRLPGPSVGIALAMVMTENFAFWPLGRMIDRHHPARRELEGLQGNPRALAAATWRHALFGVLLGALEQRLNSRPLPSPVTSPRSEPGGHRT
jgi:hypothetical protein